MLKIVLRNAMRDRGLSAHAAADEIGVAHTTILRALDGQNVDVATLVKFADWLGMRPSEVLNAIPEDASLPDQLAVLLSASPELESVIRDAVARVEVGTLDADVLKDVIAYAAFKFNTSGATNVRDHSVRPPDKGDGSSRRRKSGRARQRVDES